jgi:hypothetical protein
MKMKVPREGQPYEPRLPADGVSTATAVALVAVRGRSGVAYWPNLTLQSRATECI